MLLPRVIIQIIGSFIDIKERITLKENNNYRTNCASDSDSDSAYILDTIYNSDSFEPLIYVDTTPHQQYIHFLKNVEKIIIKIGMEQDKNMESILNNMKLCTRLKHLKAHCPFTNNTTILLQAVLNRNLASITEFEIPYGYCDVGKSDNISLILDTISLLDNLEYLDLNSNFIGPRSLYKMIQNMPATKLKRLNLSSNSLGHEIGPTCQLLQKIISKFKCLEQLDLSFNMGLGNCDIKYWLLMFPAEDLRKSSLTMLHLGNTYLGTPLGNQLREYFKSLKPGLIVYTNC
jgi:hypothetical protein